MMAKIKITQTGSPIRRDKTQRATLVGLGLNKLHRTVEVRGNARGPRPGPKVRAPAEGRTANFIPNARGSVRERGTSATKAKASATT